MSQDNVANISALLDAGTESTLVDSMDPVGRTPLHLAALCGATKVALFLSYKMSEHRGKAQRPTFGTYTSRSY